MSKKSELLLRAYIVLAAIVGVALVLIGATINIGVIQGNDWREKGDSTNLKYFDIEPERGNIYASDGYPLATSVPYFDIHLDLKSEAMTQKIFDANIDSLAHCLSKNIFKGESTTSVRRRLVRRRKAGDRYFLIKKNVTFEELKMILKFPLIRLGKLKGGRIIERKSRRLKPFRAMAARTIGLDRDNAPSVGLEGSFDESLRGDAGKILMQKVGNVWIPVHDLAEIQPQQGQNIVTTLNMRMQDICHTTLENGIIQHQADFGLAVIMEVKTGAIKAISNLDRNGQSVTEKYNHAIADATEPGSTFKLASMMALLEDKLISLDDTVEINHGRAQFGKYKMKDSEWNKHIRVTARSAFEISSNVGVATMVDQKYNHGEQPAQFIKRLKQFGLDQKTDIEILGEREPFIKDAFSKSWNKIMSLAWMAHGYELRMTPLQMLTFYNAVANGGKKMKPYIVSEINDGSKVIEKIEPQILDSRIASPATIDAAQELLEGVVESGTGALFKSRKYNFAGKTGTTKLEYWKEGTEKYQASFVGYFPAESPKYSCIVLVNNPTQKGYYGGTVAGRIFREIADKCMATDIELFADVAGDPLLEVTQMPTFHAGFAQDMKTVLAELEIDCENQVSEEWAVTIPEEDKMTLKNRKIQKDIVPNVVGMGMRDALFILENQGLKVKINGFGRVREQSIPPGTRCDGQKIMLFLG